MNDEHMDGMIDRIKLYTTEEDGFKRFMHAYTAGFEECFSRLAAAELAHGLRVMCLEHERDSLLKRIDDRDPGGGGKDGEG